MSIREQISRLRADGELVWLRPKFPGSAMSRVILLTETVRRQILGQHPDNETAIRMGRLRQDLDHFTEGGLILIARGKNNGCYLKQLNPHSDEIWEIRSRDPKPSLRLLGSFGETDVFIGLQLVERGELGGYQSQQWKIAIRQCKAEWRRLFLTYPRFTGEWPHDYVQSDFYTPNDI